MSYWLPEAELLAQCREDAMRSHGPGGQHANKTSSAVRLVHLPTAMVAICQDHRERQRNRQEALRSLRLLLALSQRGHGEYAWLAPYRHGRQLRLGANAQEFHLVVGCALDALAGAQGELTLAAAELGISGSQLAKLLTADKRVHQAANALRAAHGLGPVLAR